MNNVIRSGALIGPASIISELLKRAPSARRISSFENRCSPAARAALKAAMAEPVNGKTVYLESAYNGAGGYDGYVYSTLEERRECFAVAASR